MIAKILVGGAALAVLISVAEAAEPVSPIAGKWRITRAVVAPWTDEAGAGEQPAWIGEYVTFGARTVKGPGPIACGHVNYEATDVPPEGLFQGGLPAPASDAMIGLGLSGASLHGVSVACDTGVFEYHYADEDTLLLALDNRIWTLDRTAGTRASKNSPEGVVQRFLEAHFDGDMGFTPASVAEKRAYLAKALGGEIDAWFLKPHCPDEAPTINGDPFTDTQEYPARFAVGADDKAAHGVAVPVEFADAFARRAVRFEMTRENRRWLIADIRYEDGSTLSALLAE